MRVAYLGLAYHRRTGSTRFLLDLLERHAQVDAFFAEADIADVRRACAGFREEAYDAIVILQLNEAFALLSGRHPNVTFAPMHDAMWRGGAFTWKPSFAAAKILCFSWALRAEVMRRAPVHAHIQYAPDPTAHPPVTDFATLRGFLWYRRRDIPPATAFALTAGAGFDRLTIHDAPDPGHEAPFPADAPPHVGRLHRTAWSVDGAAFRQALAEANVFFAPRPLEGIGMSFLEAMARGLCVVAPDAPTMNEYISHGRNGLLYAPAAPAPRDFARAREIGARAREDIARGHARWTAALPALMDFLTTPTARLAARAGARGVLLHAAAPSAGGPPALIALLPPGAEPAPDAGWLLHAPPGAEPAPAALQAAIADAPGAEIIRGHHLARGPDGAEALHRTAELSAAWARLLAGEAGPEGLGVPEATLIRGGLLRRLGAPLPRSAPELCALLRRAAREGAAIHDADEILATTAPGAAGDPAGWIALAAREAGTEAAARLRDAFAARAAAAAAQRRAAAPARAALALTGALDRLSPALGRAAESLILGGPLRRLRGLLRR